MKVDLAQFDTIIFDLGGVILDIDPERTRKAFLKLVSKEELDEVFANKILVDFEKGLITQTEFRRGIEKIISVNIDGAIFNRAFNAMLIDYVPKRIERIQLLRKSHQLFMLSNTNEIHHSFFSNKLKKEYGVSFSDLFQHVYLSHKMGLIKPDLEIYKRVLIEQKLNPEKTLFIEDTKENADAAKKVGIETLVIPRNGNFYDYFI